MNKFTKRELEKLGGLITQSWDENTSHLIISRNDVVPQNLGFQLGEKFTIQLESYIINQPPNFTLAENWNKGTYPPEEVLDVTVMRVMGKMIGVKAVGKTTHIEWEGWLPQKGFKIV